MADFGIKISKKGKNILIASNSDLAFSSSFFVDKVMTTAVGINKPHGLGYKGTLITSQQDGGITANTYIDNYQINIANSTSKGIVLSQQGT